MPQQILPPNTDSALPSFVHPALADVQAELTLCLDVWNELRGDLQANYLPQEPKEKPDAYKKRLGRTKFDSRFAPAIRGYAGLLSDFMLSDDVPSSITDAQKNIDQQGNSLKSFFTSVDEAVLRDGGCGILVEFPPEPTDDEGNPLIQSAADERAFELRPYLLQIDRRDILNWDVEYVQGKPFINQVVIREHREVKSGRFGCELVVRYRVLFPGGWEIWKIVPDPNGKSGWRADLLEQGQTNLDRVPLVWYSVSEGKLFQGLPPFLNMARLNIEHLQKRSDLNECLHKVNMPVPVRKGAVKPGGAAAKTPTQTPPSLTIGPNSVVDVPVDGDFYFAEPTGAAIAASQADIDKIEKSMDRVSLAFLSGDGDRTATEVILETAQTQATLKGVGERKKSCIEQVFDLWCDYTGDSEPGSIEQNEKILQVPPSPQEVQVILDAMGVKFSNRLGLMMLMQRGWLPDETDIEAELKLIEPPAPDTPRTNPDPNPEPTVEPGADTDLLATDDAIAAEGRSLVGAS